MTAPAPDSQGHSSAELRELLARVRRLEQENEYLRSEVGLDLNHEIVAQSRSMQELLRTADRVASCA